MRVKRKNIIYECIECEISEQQNSIFFNIDKNHSILIFTGRKFLTNYIFNTFLKKGYIDLKGLNSYIVDRN